MEPALVDVQNTDMPALASALGFCISGVAGDDNVRWVTLAS